MNAATFTRKAITQRNIARRLIAGSTPAQHMLNATVEIMASETRYDDRDVIENTEEHLYYVRSSFNRARYFTMSMDTLDCSCGQGYANHKHQTMVRTYLQSNNIA